MPLFFQTKKRKKTEERIVKAALKYIAAWIQGSTVRMKNAQTDLYRAVREHPDWKIYRFMWKKEDEKE